ncbi:MAG: flagellar basal body rod protein FlgB [Armatimonadota bacterium]
MSLLTFSLRTLAVLEKALDLLALRQQAVANNIANVDTPGYRARRFDFEAQLRRALSSERTRHADPQHAIRRVRGVVREQFAPPRADGNNVQMEREIAIIARTTAQYSVIARLIASRLRALQEIAAERG